ncbi:MAG: phosphoribosyltransferase family protein [Proteobacteria bacterium]|nr:phosphoribosyltransferase family protein [Pseudomonadota bacterium]
MSDIFISNEEYNSKIEQLAIKIHNDGWDFNQIICIAKGGLRVGDVLARIFDVPLAILSVESYKGEEVKNKRGSITFSRDLAKTTPNIGSKAILVDDLADSGVTLHKSKKWLEHFYGFYFDEPMRTAVLFYKEVSTFQPDYYVDRYKDSPWIHMPFERYEEKGIIEKLIKENQS